MALYNSTCSIRLSYQSMVLGIHIKRTAISQSGNGRKVSRSDVKEVVELHDSLTDRRIVPDIWAKYRNGFLINVCADSGYILK